jgi:predicted nucleic acid-binding protein
MLISLDTNVWIFGIVGSNPFCEKILLHLSQFDVVVPNQVRVELERNLSQKNLKKFYYFVHEFDVTLNNERIPEIYITMFEEKGLKKGDAIIGGFAEWKKVDKIISGNRDFLRGLSAGHHFTVMSPQEFCADFGL